ncbi:hypothetical protein HPG69_002422 [Diceros bicornis minor]|uniref:Uncharacterized protein n=1 Tax=Diceros bicornis minor TaxID=77932 RepID=A0A7J7FNU4_DICBM|nr:hypothetical protein HPG69_002422 [Diceros bicornis minor]
MPEELHEVAGQTLSMPWQYPPEGGPYERTWCQQTSPNELLHHHHDSAEGGGLGALMVWKLQLFQELGHYSQKHQPGGVSR